MSAASTRGWDSSRREKQRAAFLLGLTTILAVLLFWLRREAGQYIFSTASGPDVEMDIDLAKGNPIDVDLRDFYLLPPGIKLKGRPGKPQPLPDYDDEAHRAFAGYDNAFASAAGNSITDSPDLINTNIDITPPSVFVGASFYGNPSPWLLAGGPGFVSGPGTGNGGGPGSGNGPGAGNGPGNGGGPGGSGPGGNNGPGGDNGPGNDGGPGGGNGPGGDNGPGNSGGPGGGNSPGGGDGPGNGGGPGGGTPVAIPEPETGILLLGGLLGLARRSRQSKAKSVVASRLRGDAQAQAITGRDGSEAP